MSNIRAPQPSAQFEAKRLEQRIEGQRAHLKNAQADDLLNQIIAQKPVKKALAETKTPTTSVFQTDNQEKKPFAEQRLLDNKFLHLPLANVKQQAFIQKRDFDFNQNLQKFTMPDHNPESLHAHDPLQNAQAAGNQMKSNHLGEHSSKPYVDDGRVKRQNQDKHTKHKEQQAPTPDSKKSSSTHQADTGGSFWLWLLALWRMLLRIVKNFYLKTVVFLGLRPQLHQKKSARRRSSKSFKAKLRYTLTLM